MISTIDRDLVVKNGIASFPMKKYPNWYGIENIGFIWHNSWTDPEIEYKGNKINSTIIEDTMWYEYTHDEYDNYLPDRELDSDGFELFMRENVNKVYELIDLVVGKL